jgi:tRNA(fMet)-specific endonuclease VapC
MTRYMLNTNIISELIRNPPGRAAKSIATGRGYHPRNYAMDAQKAVQSGCSKPSKTCSAKSACCHSMFLPMMNTVQSAQEVSGMPIGSNDLLIAAHAYAAGATIVTANVDKFKRIRGLKVENWL